MIGLVEGLIIRHGRRLPGADYRSTSEGHGEWRRAGCGRPWRYPAAGRPGRCHRLARRAQRRAGAGAAAPGWTRSGSGPVDLAVLLADGGQAIADLAVLRDQS